MYTYLTRTMRTTVLCILLSCSAVSAGYVQEAFIGEIRMFAGNFAPHGWALSDGRLLPISQKTALFSILGNTYGGDGRPTFALTDLRGRVPTGTGLTDCIQGEMSRTEHVKLIPREIPAHHGCKFGHGEYQYSGQSRVGKSGISV